MSGFVRGLVGRGAGLPLAVAIRPATGPAQLPGSLPIGAGREDSEMAAPAIVQPVVNAEAPRITEQRIEVTERAPVLEPRRETASAPAQPVLPAAQSRETMSAAPPVAPVVAPKPAMAEAMAATMRRPEPRPDLWAQAIPVPAPERPRPQLQAAAIARRDPSAPPAASSKEKGGPQESRSIQVKIGKVEIRSTQPAPAAGPAPRTRVSGFDSLRLARTYLDRGNW